MLSVLLDAFHEAFKKKFTSHENYLEHQEKIIEENQDNLSDINLLKDLNDIKDGPTIITELFQGIYKSLISCIVCGKNSRKFETFIISSIPIPKKTIKTLDCFVETSRVEFLLFKFSFNYEKHSKVTVGVLKSCLQKHLNLTESVFIAKNDNSFKENSIYNDDYPIENIRKQFYPVKILIRELMDSEMIIPEVNKILIIITMKKISHYSQKYINFRPYHQFIFFDKTKSLSKLHQEIFLYLKKQKLIDDNKHFEEFLEEPPELPYSIKISNNHESFYFETNKNDNLELPFLTNESLEEFIFLNCKKLENAFSLEIQLKSNFDQLKFKKIKEEVIIQIEQIEKKIDIYDCLNLMTMEEKLDESNKWLCPNCKKNQLCTKKLAIYQTSLIFILHFKRYGRKKITSKIQFPLVGLDLKDYIISDDSSKIYDLFAVCNHYGSDASQGHYTAFCKNKDGIWFSFDDERVEIIDNLEKIVSGNAYILFYKRRQEDNMKV